MDLPKFISVLERHGELKRVKVPVSKDFEITEITNRICKSGEITNKALLFENIENYSVPIITNLFGSKKRMALCFGLEDLSELTEKVEEIIKFNFKGSFLDLIGRGIDIFRRIKSSTSYKIVKDAPCQEQVFKEDANLYSLPIPKFWPGDGGQYITLPQVITNNPETNKRNVGMYRLQVVDEKRLLVHWQLHKNGREIEETAKNLGIRYLPCAIALGGDPLSIWASILPLPLDMDEHMVVSFWRKRPLEMAKCITQPILVPANAEIILEGYVDLEERRLEGPFGDHTGYYTPVAPYPVFHVTAITMRKDPIFPATVTGIPPMEDYWMGKAVERFFLPMLKTMLPEIRDIHMPHFGVFHNLLLVSIEKRFPGQARKVIFALWGLSMMALTKAIAVFDEDVNLEDMDQVLWHLFGSVDWVRDTVIVKGPLDELDHASTPSFYGGKIGIDATRKLKGEGFEGQWPKEVKMSQEVIDKVNAKWKLLNLE